MTTNLDAFVEIISSIELGEFDAKLNLLEKAVLERKSKIRANLTIEDFVVGNAVIINDRCGTRYLRGETGVVAGIRRTKLVIHFDKTKNNF
jgi:hypothetical protein